MDTLAGGTTPSRRATFAKCSAAWRPVGVFHSVRQHGFTVYHQLGHVAWSLQTDWSLDLSEAYIWQDVSWLLFCQPHTKLAADFSDISNLRLFVSPTACDSKLRSERPAGVTVQVLYDTALRMERKMEGKKKIEDRVINKQGQEMKK